MSTETLSPSSLDNTLDHEGFIGRALHNQNKTTAMDSIESHEKKARRPVVESIAPENIHLEGETATLDKMILARELVHDDEFEEHTQEEQAFLIDNILDRLMRDDDRDKPSYEANRSMLQHMLVESAEKFEKTQRRYELYQARRDGVKLRRAARTSEREETTPLTDRLKSLFAREQDEDESEIVADKTERTLRRDVKKLDGRFDGLVGEIAKTGTKSSYLATELEKFHQVTGPDNYEINDKNRRSAEREVLRKMVQSLVEAKNLQGDAKKAYEDELVDVFHDYTRLSDDERAEFSDALDARYASARELAVFDHAHKAEKGNKTSAIERLKQAKTTKRLLGGAALAGAGLKAGRGKLTQLMNNRTPRHKDDDGTSRSDKAKAFLDKSRNAYLRTAYETGLVFDKAKQEFSSKIADRNGRKVGETDEAYERRMRRNGSAVLLGAVALVGLTIAAKAGAFDGLFDGNGGGRVHAGEHHDGLSDLLTPPDVNTHQGIGEGHHLHAAELFSGHGESTHLSAANTEHLQGFLDSYTIKDSDNQGVWGIAEKYLHSEGVKNPSVYQIDAVKDHILAHSNLTNSSIIYPGDTINLK